MEVVYGWIIDDETWEEQRAAHRYNPAQVVEYAGKRFTIGAGSRDEIDCVSDGQFLYVTAVNRGLGYAALDVFELASESQVADVFLDDEYEGQAAVDLYDEHGPVALAEYLDQFTG